MHFTMNCNERLHPGPRGFLIGDTLSVRYSSGRVNKYIYKNHSWIRIFEEEEKIKSIIDTWAEAF